MTPHEQRNLNLAVWHAREAIAREAMNDAKNADYHTWAARDCLKIVSPSAARGVHTACDIAGVCADIEDAAGIVT